MNLSQNELRARAAAFAAHHAADRDEMRDTQTFWNDFFFNIFGVKRERVAIYERWVDKLKGARGRIDLFWPGELIIEQKSAGRDLNTAEQQALDYLHGISDAEMPKRVLTCDFRTFRLFDLQTRETHSFALAELPQHIDRFNFILGRTVRTFQDQDPVNIRASELVGLLHDLLFASGYTGHKLEVFLTRIVFCLFADDTGIFEPKDILWDYLDTRTAPDGSDLGPKLAQLFDVLNTDVPHRHKTLDPDLARFPYVNGGLFEHHFPAPSFNADMRAALLNACRFDWTPISPAIFGSLFQSVMDARERRSAGAHYTTEKNILKLIGPLFLDDLRAEFTRLCALKSGRAKRLSDFHDKLASLTFFDPACGCGNFLIIAYRELRRLELDLLLALRTDHQLRLDAASLSRVDVDQFYGIEISEFPARIAETAMWMMDHLMNRELSEAFGNYYPRIPLKKSPTIVHGDALEVDWATVLPPARCSYVLGNPPFIGQSFQSKEQREQMRLLTNPNGKNGTPLDYVGAWFLKAGAYVTQAAGLTATGTQGGGGTAAPALGGGSGAGRLALGKSDKKKVPSPPPMGQGWGGGAPHRPRIAFVATNSITQGEQVELLWPTLFERFNLEIAFAHRTFEWGSDARGKAHVHVVIIGLDLRFAVPDERRLFSYPKINGDPVETQHKAISPYLFDASSLSNHHLVVREVSSPVTHRSGILYGSKPTDGGHLILSPEEKEILEANYPSASDLVRPLVGAKYVIDGALRYCLWLPDASPNAIKTIPPIVERIRLVREFRLASPKGATNRDAEYPSLFAERRHNDAPSIVIPAHTSERRDYVPFAFFSGKEIIHNSCFFVSNATLTDFALLTSAMHMSWLRHIGGRLESRYRYSIGLVYNTFPLPPTLPAAKLDPLAQAILDARAAHPGATLATLYDPDLMPPNLRAAHTALDRAVDRLYRPAGFASDRERVEHLFTLYEGMVAPLLAAAKGPKRRGKPAV